MSSTATLTAPVEDDVPEHGLQQPDTGDAAPMSVREDILQFLRAPRAFACTLPAGDVQLWRQGLEVFAQPQIAEKGGYPFRESQVSAWTGLSNQRVGLIQGPPGTGKTYLLA